MVTYYTSRTATKVSEMLGNVNTSSALSAFEKMEEKGFSLWISTFSSVKMSVLLCVLSVICTIYWKNGVSRCLRYARLYFVLKYTCLVFMWSHIFDVNSIFTVLSPLSFHDSAGHGVSSRCTGSVNLWRSWREGSIPTFISW